LYTAPTSIPTPQPSVVPTPVWKVDVKAVCVAALGGYSSVDAFDTDQQLLFKDALVKSVPVLTSSHQVDIRGAKCVSGCSRRRLLSSSSYLAVNYSLTLYTSQEASDIEADIKTQLLTAFNSSGDGSFSQSLKSVSNESGIATTATVNRKVTVGNVKNSLSFAVAQTNPSSVPTISPSPKPTSRPTSRPAVIQQPTALPTQMPSPLPTNSLGKASRTSTTVSTATILESVLIPLGFLGIFIIFYAVYNKRHFEHCRRIWNWCFFPLQRGGGFRTKADASVGEVFAQMESNDNPIVINAEDVVDVRNRGLTTNARARTVSSNQSTGRSRHASSVTGNDL
jgi:hypothetical protein